MKNMATYMFYLVKEICKLLLDMVFLLIICFVLVFTVFSSFTGSFFIWGFKKFLVFCSFLYKQAYPCSSNASPYAKTILVLVCYFVISFFMFLLSMFYFGAFVSICSLSFLIILFYFFFTNYIFCHSFTMMKDVAIYLFYLVKKICKLSLDVMFFLIICFILLFCMLTPFISCFFIWVSKKFSMFCSFLYKRVYSYYYSYKSICTSNCTDLVKCHEISNCTDLVKYHEDGDFTNLNESFHNSLDISYCTDLVLYSEGGNFSFLFSFFVNSIINFFEDLEYYGVINLSFKKECSASLYEFLGKISIFNSDIQLGLVFLVFLFCISIPLQAIFYLKGEFVVIFSDYLNFLYNMVKEDGDFNLMFICYFFNKWNISINTNIFLGMSFKGLSVLNFVELCFFLGNWSSNLEEVSSTLPITGKSGDSFVNCFFNHSDIEFLPFILIIFNFEKSTSCYFYESFSFSSGGYISFYSFFNISIFDLNSVNSGVFFGIIVPFDLNISDKSSSMDGSYFMFFNSIKVSIKGFTILNANSMEHVGLELTQDILAFSGCDVLKSNIFSDNFNSDWENMMMGKKYSLVEFNSCMNTYFNQFFFDNSSNDKSDNTSLLKGISFGTWFDLDLVKVGSKTLNLEGIISEEELLFDLPNLEVKLLFVYIFSNHSCAQLMKADSTLSSTSSSDGTFSISISTGAFLFHKLSFCKCSVSFLSSEYSCSCCCNFFNKYFFMDEKLSVHKFNHVFYFYSLSCDSSKYFPNFSKEYVLGVDENYSSGMVEFIYSHSLECPTMTVENSSSSMVLKKTITGNYGSQFFTGHSDFCSTYPVSVSTDKFLFETGLDKYEISLVYMKESGIIVKTGSLVKFEEKTISSFVDYQNLFIWVEFKKSVEFINLLLLTFIKNINDSSKGTLSKENFPFFGDLSGVDKKKFYVEIYEGINDVIKSCGGLENFSFYCSGNPFYLSSLVFLISLKGEKNPWFNLLKKEGTKEEYMSHLEGLEVNIKNIMDNELSPEKGLSQFLFEYHFSMLGFGKRVSEKKGVGSSESLAILKSNHLWLSFLGDNSLWVNEEKFSFNGKNVNYSEILFFENILNQVLNFYDFEEYRLVEIFYKIFLLDGGVIMFKLELLEMDKNKNLVLLCSKLFSICLVISEKSLEMESIEENISMLSWELIGSENFFKLECDELVAKKPFISRHKLEICLSSGMLCSKSYSIVSNFINWKFMGVGDLKVLEKELLDFIISLEEVKSSIKHIDDSNIFYFIRFLDNSICWCNKFLSVIKNYVDCVKQSELEMKKLESEVKVFEVEMRSLSGGSFSEFSHYFEPFKNMGFIYKIFEESGIEYKVFNSDLDVLEDFLMDFSEGVLLSEKLSLVKEYSLFESYCNKKEE